MLQPLNDHQDRSAEAMDNEGSSALMKALLYCCLLINLDQIWFFWVLSCIHLFANKRVMRQLKMKTAIEQERHVEEPAQPSPPMFRVGFGCWFIFVLLLMVFKSSLYHNVAIDFRAALVWVHCMFWVVINHHLYKMWNKEILKWTAQWTFFYICLFWRNFEAVQEQVLCNF